MDVFENIRRAIWTGHRIVRSELTFNITGGVRLGCVLNLSCCTVLHFAMRKWKVKVGDLAFDLSYGMPLPIVFRFADDILFFHDRPWK